MRQRRPGFRKNKRPAVLDPPALATQPGHRYRTEPAWGESEMDYKQGHRHDDPDHAQHRTDLLLEHFHSPYRT